MNRGAYLKNLRVDCSSKQHDQSLKETPVGSGGGGLNGSMNASIEMRLQSNYMIAELNSIGAATVAAPAHVPAHKREGTPSAHQSARQRSYIQHSNNSSKSNNNNYLNNKPLYQSQQLHQSQLQPAARTAGNLFYDIFFKIKLRMFGQRLLNSTKSRMFQNLTREQYNQLDDCCAFYVESASNSNKRLNQSKLSQSAKLKQLKSIYKEQEYQRNGSPSMRQGGGSQQRNNKRDEQSVQSYKPSNGNANTNTSNTSNNSVLVAMGELRKKLRFWVRQKQILERCAALLARIPVFDPSANWKLMWDFMIMPLSLFYSIVIPLYFTFSLTLSYFSSYSAVLISSSLFLLDIVINMNTGYFEKGTLQLDRFLVLKNYINKNVAGDIIGGLYFFMHAIVKESQWTSIGTDQETGDDSVYNPLEIFMLIFLLRIANFSRTLKKLEEVSYLTKKQKNVMAVMKLLFTIIIIAHLLACFWVKLGIFQQDRGWNSWMVAKKIDREPWYVQYIESYYFTTVTMVTVGYGEIAPTTHMEQSISVVIMMISCGVFAYSMNTIGQILQDFNSVEHMVETQMAIINTYMNKKHISKQTQYKIREYLDYYWREQSEGDHDAEERIIEQLSDILKHALSVEGNKIVLKDSNIFRNNFTDITLNKTIPIIHEQRFTPEELIFEEGDRNEAQHIYFIQKGAVDFFVETESRPTKKCKVLKTLQQGKSFGEIGFFTGSARSISVRSKGFTTLLTISRSDFINLIANSEKDYESFCSIKDSLIFYQNYSVIDMKCFSCQSQSHLIHQCPQIHSVCNKDLVISKHLRSENQIRAPITRLGYLRSTCIPNVALKCTDDDSNKNTCGNNNNNNNNTSKIAPASKIRNKNNARVNKSACEDSAWVFQSNHQELIFAIYSSVESEFQCEMEDDEIEFDEEEKEFFAKNRNLHGQTNNLPSDNEDLEFVPHSSVKSRHFVTADSLSNRRKLSIQSPTRLESQQRQLLLQLSLQQQQQQQQGQQQQQQQNGDLEDFEIPNMNNNLASSEYVNPISSHSGGEINSNNIINNNNCSINNLGSNSSIQLVNNNNNNNNNTSHMKDLSVINEEAFDAPQSQSYFAPINLNAITDSIEVPLHSEKKPNINSKKELNSKGKKVKSWTLVQMPIDEQGQPSSPEMVDLKVLKHRIQQQQQAQILQQQQSQQLLQQLQLLQLSQMQSSSSNNISSSPKLSRQQQRQMLLSQDRFFDSNQSRIRASTAYRPTMKMNNNNGSNYNNSSNNIHSKNTNMENSSSNNNNNHFNMQKYREELFNMIQGFGVSNSSAAMNRSTMSQQLKAVMQTKRFMVSSRSRESMEDSGGQVVHPAQSHMQQLQQKQYLSHLQSMQQQKQQQQLLLQHQLQHQSQQSLLLPSTQQHFSQMDLNRLRTLAPQAAMMTNSQLKQFDERMQLQLKRILFEEQALKEDLLRSKFLTHPREFDVFDLQKNFKIYFPYNNLSYLLSITDELSIKQRSAQFRRIPMLNMQHIQQNIKIYVKGKNSPTLKNGSIMKRMVNKFLQKEFNSMQLIEGLPANNNADGLDQQVDKKSNDSSSEKEIFSSMSLSKIAAAASQRKNQLQIDLSTNNRRSRFAIASPNRQPAAQSPAVRTPLASSSKIEATKFRQQAFSFNPAEISSMGDEMNLSRRQNRSKNFSESVIQSQKQIGDTLNMSHHLSNRETSSARAFMMEQQDFSSTIKELGIGLDDVEIIVNDEHFNPLPPLQTSIYENKHTPFH